VTAILVPVVLVLHVVPAVFWVGTTGVLARIGAEGPAPSLRGPQTGASVVSVLFGAVLWFLLHPGAPGKAEYVLGAGALCALAALAVQQAMAWPALGSGKPDAAQRFAMAQRLSSALLVLALIAMVTFRYV
jgi:hypothetical protein